MTAPNQGHGHVVPRADGVKVRCGGPALCSICRREQATTAEDAQEVAALRAPVAIATSNAERAAFEATIGKGRDLHRAASGDYMSTYVQNDWDVWQVARKEIQRSACNFCLAEAAKARAALPHRLQASHRSRRMAVGAEGANTRNV